MYSSKISFPIGLIFSLLVYNNQLIAQDLLFCRNGSVINGKNDILPPKNIKNLLRENTSIEVQTLFKRYKNTYTIKKIILATESIFILNSVGYRTGVPKLNVTNLSIGLSAASLDMLVNKHFRKRAEKFVEEYNYHISAKNLKN